MNYTFSGFSKAGNAVVRGAIAAAQDMGHTYVGTEHLLLALARDDTGEAAAFLLERQVYGYQVGRLLREQVGCGRRTRLSPRDFTPALSKCVDCAVIEAKAVSDGKVEPVHLLAALLEAPATAGRILVQLGVEPAAAAKECGRRMGKFPLFQQTPRPVTSPRGAAPAANSHSAPQARHNRPARRRANFRRRRCRRRAAMRARWTRGSYETEEAGIFIILSLFILADESENTLKQVLKFS